MLKMVEKEVRAYTIQTLCFLFNFSIKLKLLIFYMGKKAGAPGGSYHCQAINVQHKRQFKCQTDQNTIIIKMSTQENEGHLRELAGNALAKSSLIGPRSSDQLPEVLKAWQARGTKVIGSLGSC